MKPSNGMAGVFGLKFRDGPDDLPVIESVAPDSPAAQQGLTAGMEIDEINGVNVTSREAGGGASCWASTSSTCCFAAAAARFRSGPSTTRPSRKPMAAGR